MSRYTEVANQHFTYFTSSTLYGLFDRLDTPDTPEVLPYRTMKQRAMCQLQILQGDAETLVIATELDDNPGASITNGAEALVTQVVTDFQLTPTRTRFFERYTQSSYEGRKSERDTFDEVTFTWEGTRASNPTWRRLSPQEIATLQE